MPVISQVCYCSGSVSGATAAARSEKLQLLEQKLYKAQEELMEFHRKKGEVSELHVACEVVLSAYYWRKSLRNNNVQCESKKSPPTVF